MDRADLILASLLAYSLATALHLGLAALILARRSRHREVQIFGLVNLVLAAWHFLQLAEYGMALASGGIESSWAAHLARAQVLLELLVLVIFFQLFATFQRIYRRPPPSLRAAIITHVQKRQRIYIALVWWGLVLALIFYASGSTRFQSRVGEWRSLLGSLSAYLFAGVLIFLTLILFPSRPGQERVGVAVVGRSLMLLVLLGCVLLVALWHEAHPTRIRLAVLPLLHLQSVSFVIFFSLVRYEFSFMDRYIRDGIRLLLWMILALTVFFLFNRIEFLAPGWGRYATSLARVGLIFLAVAIGPALDRAGRPWMDRVLFDRDVNLVRAVHAFSERLSRSRSLSELEQGALQDIQAAVHPKSLRLLIGDTERNRRIAKTLDDGENQYRLRVSLSAAGRRVGWLLLGERRNCYPWFQAERKYLSLVGELLGSALDAMGAGGLEVHSGAARRARHEDLQGELESLRSKGNVLLRERDAARRELAEVKEKLDPDLIASVLEIAVEVGERDVDEALEILRALRRTYAYILDPGDPLLSLGEEMAFVRDLLALEKLRFRNRLEVSLSLDPELERQLIPRCILQALIENALVHGLAHQLRAGSIQVRATVTGKRCRIIVEDNGRGFLGDLHQDALRGDGGLARVLRALKECFGDDVTLRLESPKEPGTRIRLDFPRQDIDVDKH